MSRSTIKRSRLIAKILWRWSIIAWDGRERYREEEDKNVLGGGERGERAGRMGADSRREREREAVREKQEEIDKGLGAAAEGVRREQAAAVPLRAVG